MEAPKCRKIPSCGKRHYGECGGGSGERPDGSSRSSQKKKKSVPEKKVKATPDGSAQADVELLARVESLESRVLELESRKKYMRDYMAQKRAEEKG